MSPEQEGRLSRLLAAYREALGDPEPSPQFLPAIWQKIDAAKPISWIFPLKQFALRLVAASALGAAILTGSAMLTPDRSADAEDLGATYVDVLTVSSMDEDEGVLWLQAESLR
ncbi:MAG: hypothetical protein WD733_12145 [Bryobacterales bacterium]